MRYLKNLFISLFIFGCSVVAGVFLINFIVENSARKKVFSSVEEISHNKVGLLLGTSKYVSSGRVNLYYKYRIDAAVALFKAGKIDYILVSGDNSSYSYDEPTTFKKDLEARGIPSNKIYLDYAGFRTLDSVVRSKKVFGQSSITVISQEFHNERALFLAKRKGVKAIGFNAKDVSANYGVKTQTREKFARVKMVLDLIVGVQPKFLGEAIEIK